MPDPDHSAHHPLLAITVSHCPGQQALHLDVDLGTPVPGVTADEVGQALAVLMATLLPRLDGAWVEVAATLN
jgi:hypothetical protein